MTKLDTLLKIIVLAAIIVGIFTACGNSSDQSNLELPNRFERVYCLSPDSPIVSRSFTSIYRDTVTDVEYIVVQIHYGIAVTPLLNAAGYPLRYEDDPFFY